MIQGPPGGTAACFMIQGPSGGTRTCCMIQGPPGGTGGPGLRCSVLQEGLQPGL